MVAPYSRVKEKNLTDKVIGRSGVSVGIVIPDAIKGDTATAQLVTSQTEFLTSSTADGELPSGANNAYYSALAYLEAGISLYWIRAIGTGALLGGTGVNTAATVPLAQQGTVTAATSTTITLTAAPALNSIINITAGTGVNQSARVLSVVGLVATVAPAFQIIPDTTSTYKVYTPALPLAAGVATPAAHVYAAGETVFFAGSSVGAWANNIFIKTLPYFPLGDVASPDPLVNDPLNVGEPNAFRLEVYLAADLFNPVESWTLSRDVAHKNGYNVNIFVDTTLQASNYVRGYSNPLIANTAQVAYTPAPIPLTAGVDGLAATDGQVITAMQVFTNTITYPLTALVDGGRATPPVAAAISALCVQRNDCLPLLSVPYATEQLGAQAVVAYRQSLNIDSSFGSLSSSWVRIYDRFNSKYVYVSPDGYIASLIAKNDFTGNVWDAPAGEVNGLINVRGVAMQWSQGDMNLLYDNQINPVLLTQQGLIMLWGQKTLKVRPSDDDRMNVRLMLNVVEPALQSYMRGFVFQINDAATRNLATIGADSYMKTVKALNGVFDYKIVCDASNNPPAIISQNKLNLDVYIKVSMAAEFITTTVVLTPRGTSFAKAATL